MSDTFREASKLDYDRKEAQVLGNDDLKVGCLQRIADATELLAKNWASLTEERDYYKRWYAEERDRNAALYRRIKALRGVITRLKGKA